MKTCSKCKEVKPLDEFHKQKKAKDGRQSECGACANERMKEYRARPEVKKRVAEYRAKPENKKRAADRNLQSKYGITMDEYNQMYNKQKGSCRMCGVHQSQIKKTLCVDHNHETGEVRELLCDKCNKALGLLDESIEIFEAGIDYLRRHK